MNLVRWLLLPWWATTRAMQIAIGALLGLILLTFGAIAVFHYIQHSSMPDSADMLSIINLLVWALLLPNLLVLARDARALRLPALEREAVISLGVYAILFIVAPSLLFNPPGFTTAQFMLALSLCAGIGMAYMCLPGYFALVIVIGWLLYDHAGKALGWPQIGQAGSTTWVLPTLILLLLAIAWSWRRVLHNAVSASSYNAPMILKFRNNAWNNRSAGIGNNGGSAMIRQRPNWMLSQPDLRRCGPEYPQHSLRLAMGGMFMPLTVTSRLRQCAFFVLPSLLFVAVMMLLSLQNHHGDGALSLWKAGGFAALVWGGGFGASMLAFACLMQLAMRWRSANAELPLLTLLPGLPAGERGKHALLRAILIPALRWQLALWLVLLCCMVGLHLSKSSDVFLLLTPLGAMGFTIAFVLLIVGGKLPRPWASTALGIFGCVLINVSLFIPALNDTSTMRIGGGSLLELLAAAWIVLGSVLLWLGYRGWNGVVQRRHLFLPS